MYDDERLEELRKRAAAIAEPIWETLLRDIVRRVRGAGGITSTAEYQIYRTEQLGLAEKAIKAALAEQLKISDAAIDMLFEELRDETGPVRGKRGAAPAGGSLRHGIEKSSCRRL